MTKVLWCFIFFLTWLSSYSLKFVPLNPTSAKYRVLAFLPYRLSLINEVWVVGGGGGGEGYDGGASLWNEYFWSCSLIAHIRVVRKGLSSDWPSKTLPSPASGVSLTFSARRQLIFTSRQIFLNWTSIQDELSSRWSNQVGKTILITKQFAKCLALNETPAAQSL